MKVFNIFVHMSDESYRLLMGKYKDEVMIKSLLSIAHDKAISEECQKIKDEDFKSIGLLDKEIKL